MNIHQIQTNYTTEMEKAMYQSYGIGYEEYNRTLDNRLKVEQKREMDHQKSLTVVNESQKQMRS